MNLRQTSLRTLLLLVTLSVVAVAVFRVLFPPALPTFSSEGYILKSTALFPPCSVFWFTDEEGTVVSGVAAFGKGRPEIFVSSDQRTIGVPSKRLGGIDIPNDGFLYILGADLNIHKTSARIGSVANSAHNYEGWAAPLSVKIEEHVWP